MTHMMSIFVEPSMFVGSMYSIEPVAVDFATGCWLHPSETNVESATQTARTRFIEENLDCCLTGERYLKPECVSTIVVIVETVSCRVARERSLGDRWSESTYGIPTLYVAPHKNQRFLLYFTEHL